MRTVKWWVRYRPESRTVCQRTYRRKVDAERAQRGGEVVFQVKGFYFPVDAEGKQ